MTFVQAVARLRALTAGTPDEEALSVVMREVGWWSFGLNAYPALRRFSEGEVEAALEKARDELKQALTSAELDDAKARLRQLIHDGKGS